MNRRFTTLLDVPDERSRRLVAAAESLALGRGGIPALSQATGMARQAIRHGVAELREPALHPPGRVRRPGGGRKKIAAQDGTMLSDLERLVEPVTRGEPEPPLRWTCKSVRGLATELREMGRQTSRRMVAELLRALRYSLQANRQTKEGPNHPDRNAQFEYPNRKVQRRLALKQPVISVDTKKREVAPMLFTYRKAPAPEGIRGPMNRRSRPWRTISPAWSTGFSPRGRLGLIKEPRTSKSSASSGTWPHSNAGPAPGGCNWRRPPGQNRAYQPVNSGPRDEVTGETASRTDF